MLQVRARGLQLLTHAGALAPLAVLLWDVTRDQLGFNPIQEITARTGQAALLLLVLSLASTPLNTLFGWKQLLPLRRPLGLYAFGYVCLHLLTFLVLDFGLEWEWIWQEISEKRYILVGFAAFLLLLPLALTSTRWAMRRLGKRWKQLHRLVYVAAPLAVLHYLWLVKADIREPLLYGGIVALLLLLRWAPIRRMVSRLRHRLRGSTGKRSPTWTAPGS
jgi:methionine sulfoxide reductase heme-binding subunit